MSREVAKARQSQLVTTYGVGSLFPAQNQSFMIMGLDSWSDRSPEILEPRLARLLGVSDFRAPAVNDSNGRDLPVIRFPEWHFCPQCRRLDPIWKFTGWNDNTCPDCQAEPELVPSRFVTCCERGHIDEFPYHRWLHAEDQRAGPHSLRLIARGRSSSLADIQIHCSCGIQPVSLDGAFDAGALKGLYRCKGRRPWLADTPPEECTALPRTLQRGSSNVWFPVTRSAISIPPWSEGAFKVLERHWKVLLAVPLDALEGTIANMDVVGPGYPLSELVAAVRRARGIDEVEQRDAEDLRADEYGALRNGRPETSRQQDFVCDEVEVAPGLRSRVTQVSRVSRLREVRALRAFTRVLPPAFDTDPQNYAPLAAGPTSWLPAIQVIGEGIFVRLDPERLAVWESTTFAQGRAQAVQQSIDDRTRGRGLAERPLVTPRQLLIHTLAHALIDQLSLDAGYPSASLRERLYADGDMAGFLVYTATSDSAGSLGGVAAQSNPDRFEHAVGAAIARMSWCSSDPVCIESTGTGTDALNLAACHSCLLLPETSCELSNTFLDRATLVGLPGVPDGFFSPDRRT